MICPQGCIEIYVVIFRVLLSYMSDTTHKPNVNQCAKDDVRLTNSEINPGTDWTTFYKENVHCP